MPRVRGSSRSRGQVADRPAAWRLLLRRQRRVLRPIIWGLAGFAVVLFITVLFHEAAPGGTLASLRERLADAVDMRVRKVVIEGRDNTPEPLLWAALGISKGDPILSFSVDQARKRIESLSWVEHVSVERRLPSTIIVALTERKPFAIWQHDGKFSLIGRDGDIVEGQNLATWAQLPLVVGEGAPAHAAAMLDMLKALPAVQSHVMAIVRVGDRRWNLDLKNGTTVMLPEGAEQAALNRLLELQTGHALLDRPLAVIDMRLPDRLVLRPRAEQTPTDSHALQASAKRAT